MYCTCKISFSQHTKGKEYLYLGENGPYVIFTGDDLEKHNYGKGPYTSGLTIWYYFKPVPSLIPSFYYKFKRLFL